MYCGLALFALASLAIAIPAPLDFTKQERSLPSGFDYRDLLARDEEPCKILSKAYKEKLGEPGKRVLLDVPPSIGIACLKSVPVDKKRDLELLDYLIPFVEFQSTLEVLDDPPEEYLLPGVDVLGGIEVIRSTLKKDGYLNQYDMMKELQSLFVAAHDTHFHYFSGLLSVMGFNRPGFKFVSLSSDGVRLPETFMTTGAIRGNKSELEYHPSAVSSIDGTPVTKWLEDNSMYTIAGCQDPDALYNTQFYSLPGAANSRDGGIMGTEFEIPDSHTVKFRNGTVLIVQNQIIIPAASDFTNIETGEDVHNAFEVPPTTTSTAAESEPTTTGTLTSTAEKVAPTTDHIPNYPYPVKKHSMDSIAGYFLNDTGYEDVAVLSILSFVPLNAEITADKVDDYVLEARDLLSYFLKKAKADNRDKLVIDVSANGGGNLVLVREVYRLLFPDGKFNAWDRWPVTPFLDIASSIDYESMANYLYGGSLPINVEGEQITSREEWFGPYTLKSGQNMTDACHNDYNLPWDAESLYYNGVRKNDTVIEEALFKPENILVVTDGFCGSACTILTGLLTRNYGIRTLALGGRPVNQAMQAMGGVKGTLSYSRQQIVSAVATFVQSVEDNDEAIAILDKASGLLPSLEDPPLLDTGKGINVNGLSSYTEDSLDGYPVHFRYEAANCRLFYTKTMLADMSEQWRRAVGVAWKGAQCVSGSTTNSDGTMGNKPPKFESRVRSTAKGVTNPGWPKAGEE
ncbi:hypothetical protein B0T10DRAFT_409367 [Thelonectria olida]|uniref:CPAF-like PDZ domain-containing protein n=1 Tax=Thelonectria olida TaxID=1576542 RepID=A0A9P9APQ7_9HYPO|nr:hypothetical protein B0T10DRAFT_409367 [Thelonectria olida]